MRYEIRYQGAPHAPGAEHVESQHKTAGAAAKQWLGLGPLLRRERALVEVGDDGTERALLVEGGSDWYEVQYVDGGRVHFERWRLKRP